MMMVENTPKVQKRVRWTAILLGLIALAFYVGFFFAVSHRGF